VSNFYIDRNGVLGRVYCDWYNDINKETDSDEKISKEYSLDLFFGNHKKIISALLIERIKIEKGNEFQISEIHSLDSIFNWLNEDFENRVDELAKMYEVEDLFVGDLKENRLSLVSDANCDLEKAQTTASQILKKV